MEPEPVAHQRHLLPRALVIVVVALAVGLAVIFALLWRQAVAESAVTDAGEAMSVAHTEAAIEAAADAITRMTTYSHASAEDDFTWVNTAATPEYQAQFAEVSQPVQELVQELKIHSEGVVLATGANIVDSDTIEVLVFVDQSITNEINDGEVLLEQPRILATMVRTGSTWLVDDVELYSRTGAAALPEAATE